MDLRQNKLNIEGRCLYMQTCVFHVLFVYLILVVMVFDTNCMLFQLLILTCGGTDVLQWYLGLQVYLKKLFFAHRS